MSWGFSDLWVSYCVSFFIFMFTIQFFLCFIFILCFSFNSTLATTYSNEGTITHHQHHQYIERSDLSFSEQSSFPNIYSMLLHIVRTRSCIYTISYNHLKWLWISRWYSPSLGMTSRIK